MGIFWDLLQQEQIERQKEEARSLEERVAQLEQELAATRKLLIDTLHVLEKHVGQDIDQDGSIG
jgi:septal ring factor EnvC (AmiA/AmiB activator)